MNFQTLKLENEGTTWLLTISRPESLNALSSQVLKELKEVIAALAHKSFSEARCLIITGAGEKAFVAGADIKEISSLDSAAAKDFAVQGQNVFRALENLQIPVIAAVNGFALGGGLELALACDFIYCSDNAKFGLPEVTLGLIPGFGGTVRLSRAVGLAQAKEWIFSGQMCGAEDALKFGLVNKVTSLAELLPTVKKLAATIGIRAPVALKHAKISIQASYDLNIDEAMNFEAGQFANLFSTTDVKEGTSAFLEKRKPTFKGN